MDISHLTTWIELSESAYRSNLTFFRNLLPTRTELSVVVKSNAYGHGIREIALLAVKHGADSFCVHALEEALFLRKNGFTRDILIMGPVMLNQLEQVITHHLRLVVYNMETLLQLQKLIQNSDATVRIHLKLETGTYRQGIDQKKLPEFLTALKAMPRIQVEGVYTHFANIEDTTNHDYAFRQLNLFTRMTEQIGENGFPNVKRHTACSAATLLFPETHFEMVRLGISQYGFWPSRETFVSYKSKFTQIGSETLRPVLSWKTRIGQVKEVPVNQSIGYGGTYQTTRDSKIAVLPIGYADGYDRGLSNQSYVLIRGQRAPVRGRICMNLIMVDISDIPGVQLEDEVTLLGKEGTEKVTADHLASLCGTINYEFVARLNDQVPRIVVQ